MAATPPRSPLRTNPNEITLTATADGYEEGQQTIPFAEEMTADFALAADLDEFTITATVVNADDEPVAGISVSSDAPDLAGTTDSGGQVTFTYTEVPGLSEITLSAHRPGGLYEDASVSINANADVTYTATLEDVTVEATASGMVTDDEGAPIEAATVTFAQSELGIDASTPPAQAAPTRSLSEPSPGATWAHLQWRPPPRPRATRRPPPRRRWRRPSRRTLPSKASYKNMR